MRRLSRIEREYEASDQRRFFVPCPHCDHREWLIFERLRWEKELLGLRAWAEKYVVVAKAHATRKG